MGQRLSRDIHYGHNVWKTRWRINLNVNSAAVVLSVFQIAATETTQQQYRHIHPDYGKAVDLPVVDVTWNRPSARQQSAVLCQPRHSGNTAVASAGFRGRLAMMPHYWNSMWLTKFPWSEQRPKRLPNPLGLYDMYGNV
jgi:hypothetical protein